MKINSLASFGPNKALIKYIYNVKLGPKDVVVKIKYRTLSISDILFIDNFWGNSKYPIIPSEDIIGEVVSCGKKVSLLKKGDFIGIGYQVYSCGNCYYCRSALEQFCQEQKLLRFYEPGGLSDFMVVNEKFAFKLKKKLINAESTPLMCAGLTTYSAIVNNNVKKGFKVGVVGIGRLGHLAVKFLKAMNCEVYAFTHSLEKKGLLNKQNINVVNINNNKEIGKFNRFFDFILYTSTNNPNWETYIQLLKPEGKLCVVGLPSENISFPAWMLADFSRKQVVGNYIGSRKDMIEMLEFASQNNIHADTKVFSFKEANHVLDMIRQKKILFSAVIEG